MPTPILFLIVFLALCMWAFVTPGPLDRAISTSLAADSPEPLMEELHKKPIDFIGRFYHKMMTQLWDNNHREMAARFAQKFVLLHPKVGRGHVWVTKIKDEEPEIATRVFEKGFLSEHYNPNATCGAG